MHEDKHLFLSIISGTGSIGSCIGAYLTQSNVAWFIGIIAGLYSIYCSYLTHREKILNIKKLKAENSIWKAKNLHLTSNEDSRKKHRK